jgi:hypothetical protein
VKVKRIIIVVIIHSNDILFLMIYKEFRRDQVINKSENEVCILYFWFNSNGNIMLN